MRFTTREVFLAITVAGLLLGWYLDRRLTIAMFDGFIQSYYNHKHIGGGVPYGRYVPITGDDDRIWFQLEDERRLENWLATNGKPKYLRCPGSSLGGSRMTRQNSG